MKKLLFLLVYLLTFTSYAHSQTKEKPIKRHPMSKHFGWDEFGMYRMSMGYSMNQLGRTVPLEENTGMYPKLNYFKNGYTDVSIFGVINPEYQNIFDLGMTHNGPSGINSIHIGYGQTGMCNFFEKIFRLKICGVWTTGLSLRSRTEGYEEEFDFGFRTSYIGSNTKIAIKSYFEFYNAGPINYSVSMYRFFKTGILIESGITNNMPSFGIGYAIEKIRLSTNLGYNPTNNSYFNGIMLHLAF